jgi:hypothetical protein
MSMNRCEACKVTVIACFPEEMNAEEFDETPIRLPASKV